MKVKVTRSETWKCQFCGHVAKSEKWKDNKCPYCSRKYSWLMAQETEEEIMRSTMEGGGDENMP